MIVENTWHRDPTSRKSFEWNVTLEGIELQHGNENPLYVIPWPIFQAIFQQAQALAHVNGNVVVAGTHQSDPTPGSVGAWVLQQGFILSTGLLTPRHLSFIGPILGRMGFITRQLNGNSIQWVFP